MYLTFVLKYTYTFNMYGAKSCFHRELYKHLYKVVQISFLRVHNEFVGVWDVINVNDIDLIHIRINERNIYLNKNSPTVQASKSINQAINQLIKQSIKQSIKHPINRSESRGLLTGLLFDKYEFVYINNGHNCMYYTLELEYHINCFCGKH